jgi:hypothetical protein
MYMATQADGILVTAGQIFVRSLDAEPREQDIISGVASIDAGEITADKITVSNLELTGSLSATGDMDLTAFTNVYRMSATQIGIGTTNPVNDFQVGTNRFVINRQAPNLVTVAGNITSSNLISSTIIRTTNDKFVVNSDDSNVLKVTGNTFSTNVTVRDRLYVGSQGLTPSNIAYFQNGNVVVDNGDFLVFGNVVVSGNVSVTEDLTYKNSNNLVVSNAIIQMADGVPGGTYDSGIIMTDHPGVEANLVIGYSTANTEFMFARTFGSAHTVGGIDIGQTVPLDSNTINIHVYGRLYTEGNVGVANSSTDYTLCVGSNVYVDDTGSDLIRAKGNVHVDRLVLGAGGILSTGGLLQLNPDANPPVQIDANVQMVSLRTTGVHPTGISNTSPTNSLSVGSKVFVNLTSSNTLTILGNTVAANLETRTIFSSSNIVIHADQTGPDSTSNLLVLKSGPIASNVSSIEIFGANTSNTHQNIRFKTKNTEQLRITSDGKLGIKNTNPSETLTISGNVHVTGSNAVIYGNTWGSNGMRMYSNPNIGENKIENIVSSGKGLNFYASTTSTMGSPKMTILETSNVGIGTSQPQSRLHTSGGTVFINNQPGTRDGFDHLGTPLVVSNTQQITSTSDLINVLDLAAPGTVDHRGARASFRLGKHELTSGKSQTKMDIFLADQDYADDADVLTLRSDGRVGIGSTEPEAFLEVVSSGIGNTRTNSLMVHNHGTSAGDAIIAAQTDAFTGNAFISFIQSNEDVDPRGWSVGVTDVRDFRITKNINRVDDPTNIGIYMSGANSNVGIGTDVTRGELEVYGNVVLGNMITFGGLPGDEFGNTSIIERNFDATGDFNRNELLFYKGNKLGSANQGPSRIRHIAAEHIFDTYSSADQTLSDLLDGAVGESLGNVPLCITDLGTVVIGGNRDDAADAAARTNTKLIVKGDVEFAGTGTFKLTGFDFLTTEGGTSRNIIRSILNGSTRRPITFTHEDDENPLIDDIEFARFDTAGRLGIGTTTVRSNIHVYDSRTTDIDMLRLESPGTNKSTGILLYTNPGFGGYVRGFRNSTNSTTGITIGTETDFSEVNVFTIVNTSNVGIGTVNPLQKFHIYNGTQRIEHSSSNAVIEFKTTGGTSNILSDTLGNVYINPESTETVINSNLTIINDITVGGNIDLGNQVAIDLGGDTANTSLQVGGGIITNSNQVAHKRYAHTFERTFSESQDVQIVFGTGSFYAKIVAVLRRVTSTEYNNMSTLVLEVQGGSHDGSTSTVDIAVGTKNLFGGTNSYPWSSTVTTGKTGIVLKPYQTTNASGTEYSYDISVELMSSRNGNLASIKSNSTVGDNPGPDNTDSIEIVSFDY